MPCFCCGGVCAAFSPGSGSGVVAVCSIGSDFGGSLSCEVLSVANSIVVFGKTGCRGMDGRGVIGRIIEPTGAGGVVDRGAFDGHVLSGRPTLSRAFLSSALGNCSLVEDADDFVASARCSLAGWTRLISGCMVRVGFINDGTWGVPQILQKCASAAISFLHF